MKLWVVWLIVIYAIAFLYISIHSALLRGKIIFTCWFNQSKFSWSQRVRGAFRFQWKMMLKSWWSHLKILCRNNDNLHCLCGLFLLSFLNFWLWKIRIIRVLRLNYTKWCITAIFVNTLQWKFLADQSGEFKTNF